MKDWIQHYLNYLTHLKQYSKLTIQSYEQVLINFYQYCVGEGFEQFGELQYTHIRGFIMYQHEQHLSHQTIRHHISVLRSFFNYLLENDQTKVNPFALVCQPKVMKKMPEFLYMDEFELLVNSIDVQTTLGQRNRMIIELLYATGLRIEEAVNIKLKDIDFATQTIRVKGKGNKMRDVPFHPLCELYLKEYLDSTRKELMDRYFEVHDFLFVNQYGKAITTRGVANMIDRVAKKSPLKKKIHPHMFRHTFATHLLNEGADIRVVQEMMGHADLSSTQIYIHVTTDKLKNTYLNAHPLAKKRTLAKPKKD